MHKIIPVFLIVLSQLAHADQKVIPNYHSARNILWQEVYQNLNKEDTLLPSLYCKKKPLRSPKFQLDHIVAASWMKKAAGCSQKTSRRECRHKSSRFKRMESDLHNLYAVETWANQKRGNAVFGDISEKFKNNCKFKVKNGRIEPRSEAKGMIARALLYFEKEYKWDMNKETHTKSLRNNMLVWHCKHPPEEAEIQRHHIIENIQKTSNPYVLNQNLECAYIIK
ncbi:MAG: endonuclease [Oligoflexales bacterium]